MSAELLDMSVMNDIKELMDEGFIALVEKYDAQSRDYLTAIAQGVEQQDVDRVIKAAHPLKSSSQQLGLMQLYELARSIELGGKEAGAVTGVLKERIAGLSALYEDSIAALKQAAA